MFDMQKIGKTIAELRKKVNLTQFALADKLGISFQAVSNWERGVSMPDIAKLPELAEFFGVPIDAILGEENPLVESAIEDRLPEYLAENPVSAEELEETAAMLPPTEVEEVISSIGDDLGSVTPFLPFVGKDFVGALAKKRVAEGKGIAPLLPFMDKGSLRECAFADFEKKGVDGIACYLPFLKREDIGELARLTQQKGGRIQPFLPFMDKSFLRECAFADFEKKGVDGIACYLPFLNREAIGELVRLTRQKGDRIQPFLSFMDKDLLRECAFADCAKNGIRGAAHYLPFMRKEDVAEMLLMVVRSESALPSEAQKKENEDV